jgi:hypothetical protein
MKTCGTCRHWGPALDDERADMLDDSEATGEERTHAAMALTDPLRKCEAVPFYYDDKGLAAVACVRDGSGYRVVARFR